MRFPRQFFARDLLSERLEQGSRNADLNLLVVAALTGSFYFPNDRFINATLGVKA